MKKVLFITFVCASIFASVNSAHAQTFDLGTADIDNRSSEIISSIFGVIGIISFVVVLVFIIMRYRYMHSIKQLGLQNNNQMSPDTIGIKKKLSKTNTVIIVSFLICIVAFMGWAVLVFSVCCGTVTVN